MVSLLKDHYRLYICSVGIVLDVASAVRYVPLQFSMQHSRPQQGTFISDKPIMNPYI